ncbi:ABC-F family ATP-binding cassette domain-containing protein [Candidatus Nomurabacteria bacterium]|nr:ABC-F family ATP-binding cassette domain-containing protein [Candidatus Nomurabacteria bacterium]
MFTLRHIYKSFSDRTVLEDVSLSVNAGEVIALIGENGAGKTTLLEILLGTTRPDSGHVERNGETVGYIPQEAVLSRSVRESFHQNTEEWRINYALSQVDLDIPLATQTKKLSGGQKTRLAFAVVLATVPEPTVLLLDEPTNNLDTDGLKWLRRFIERFSGVVLLVSHDRAFINDIADRVIELKDGRLAQYGGNYDFYSQQKDIERRSELVRYTNNLEERQKLKKAICQQQEQGQHTHNHIKRSDGDKYQRDFFRNRVTKKFGQQARALEKRLEQLDDVEKPETIRSYRVALSGEVHQQKLICRLNNIDKAYSKPVIDGVSLEIRGNERIQVTGSNGSGKTTLLKIVAGAEVPDGGQITIGTDVSIGYFSQDVNGLDHSRTALENLEDCITDSTALFREARSLGLSKFDLEKKTGELSRGQQAKLGFAKLLLSAHQLLILDEPTNHLDIRTKEQIENALQHYKGAILVASHDSYFVDTLNITKVVELIRE